MLFFLPLKDLGFIIYSGQLIYGTEFAKHSALQYRLFVSFHKTFFFIFYFFNSVFLQLCPGCFIISTDLDPYLSQCFAAQLVTISSQSNALGVWMVLQQPWHDSTIPLEMASRDPTCICGYIREDLMEFVGANVQKPVGSKNVVLLH